MVEMEVRIRVEYCNTLSGSTTPTASTQELDCYDIEQIEQSPYDTTRFYLPEEITDSQSYLIQYGRLFEFSAGGQQTSSLRLKRQVYGSVNLDALISNTGVSSGTLDFCLDIGDDGSCDYVHNASTDFPATLDCEYDHRGSQRLSGGSNRHRLGRFRGCARPGGDQPPGRRHAHQLGPHPSRDANALYPPTCSELPGY